MSSSRKTLIFKLAGRDWALIFIFAFLRLLLSLKYSLGVDEAHYALYGMRVDWSYFDHPPLLGWINAAFLYFFGVHDWVVRLPAILCGVISSVLSFRLALQISDNEDAAWWVVLAINVSFLPFGLFMMFLPDTLLLPLTLWLVFAIKKLIEEASWSHWLELGLCLGLCGLSKYTAVLFVIPLLILAFSEGVWKKWLSGKFVVASLLALLLISPVLYWNKLHHWISFAYQSGHVVGEKNFSVKIFLNSLAAQFIAYSPFLVLLSVWGTALKKHKHLLSRVALWILFPCFLFFAYSGFRNFVLPHWALIVYVLLFIVGISESFENQKFRKYTKLAIAASGVLVVMVLSELFFQWIPFKDYQSAYGDLSGWHELHDEMKAYKEAHPELKLSVGVANWTLGSRSIYYFSDIASVFVLDDRYDQFDLWEEKQTPTEDFFLLHWKGFDFPVPLEKMCQSHQTLSSDVFRKRNYIVTEVDLILCKGFNKSLLQQPDQR